MIAVISHGNKPLQMQVGWNMATEKCSTLSLCTSGGCAYLQCWEEARLYEGWFLIA